MESINPYNGSLLRTTEELTVEEIESILLKSARAFEAWKRTEPLHRNDLLKNAASQLRAKKERLAHVITSEMGKPVMEAKTEIEKCAWLCDYYAENAVSFLEPETIKTDADSSYVIYDPLGVILGIMPWNFPFWQVFRFAVPTLMAGNSVVLKHASNVQICAEEIEKIFIDAGFPPYIFANMRIGSGKVEQVIKSEVVKAVSLTGSESAGRKVAEIAGSVLKKCVLELGGNNAFIVLENADIEKAAETAVKARFQNAGQSCIAAKRFIVQKRVSNEFIDIFREKIRQIRLGDPSDPTVEMGPLSGTRQAEVVEEQVLRSVEAGAKVIEGGKRDGAFYQPSLVTEVIPGMPLFDEEVFGPVAPVTIAEDIADAVYLAGKSAFGLGVSVFTNDIEKAELLIREFHDGAVFINGLVKSDPRLPFGGTRNSGFGRELSRHGIREFVNAKTIWIKRPVAKKN